MNRPVDRGSATEPSRTLLSPRLIFLATAILVVMALRVLPHPPNFTPVGACALFGGACFADRRSAFGVPLASMALSDLLLGFHLLSGVVYACFAVQVGLGFWLRSRRRPIPIAIATFTGACVFFLITNAACWLAFYPKTIAGLTSCYVAAVPFFGYTLLGDALFVSVLFGTLAVVEGRFPALRERATLVVA